MLPYDRAMTLARSIRECPPDSFSMPRDGMNCLTAAGHDPKPYAPPARPTRPNASSRLSIRASPGPPA